MIAMSPLHLQRLFNIKAMVVYQTALKTIQMFAIQVGEIFRFRLIFLPVSTMIMIHFNSEFTDQWVLDLVLEQEVYKYMLIVVIGLAWNVK